MADNGRTEIPGLGILTYQRAIDIARNTEGDLDPQVQTYLENALAAIWGRIIVEPDTYILSVDEFALFNFFIARNQSPDVVVIAENAIARYWTYTGQPRTT